MCVMWEGSWYSLFYGDNYSKTLVGTLFGFQQVSTWLGWLGVGVIIIHKIYCLYSIKTIMCMKSPHDNRCTNVCMCVCVCVFVCEYPSSIHNLAEMSTFPSKMNRDWNLWTSAEPK